MKRFVALLLALLLALTTLALAEEEIPVVAEEAVIEEPLTAPDEVEGAEDVDVPEEIVDLGADADGEASEAVANDDGVALTADNFPDPNLLSAVSGYDYDEDGFLSSDELYRFDSLEVYDVQSLEGIQLIPNLNELECNDISCQLDFSCAADMYLNFLSFYNCTFETVDLSALPYIHGLYIHNCSITRLDVSNLPGLEALMCSYNPELSQITLGESSLYVLDVTQCEKLAEVDVRHCYRLMYLLNQSKPEQITYDGYTYYQWGVPSKESVDGVIYGPNTKIITKADGGTVTPTVPVGYNAETNTLTFKMGSKGSALYCNPGAKLQLNPINKPVKKVTYTSSNKSIATVSKKGVVTFKKINKKVKITVKCGKKKSVITLRADTPAGE